MSPDTRDIGGQSRRTMGRSKNLLGRTRSAGRMGNRPPKLLTTVANPPYLPAR